MPKCDKEFVLSWTTFSISVLVMISSGSIFAFSSFSESFRATLGYSASDINFISGLGNAAVYIAFLIAGLLYDHFGAQITMASSTLAYGFGYLLMWLTFTGKISGGAVSMSFYYFLAGYGSSAVYLVATAVCLKNFKNETVRGVTLGVLLLFYGISATIYAQIYSNFYSTSDYVDTAGFLLFMAVTAFLFNFIGTLGIIDVNLLFKKARKRSKRRATKLIKVVPELDFKIEEPVLNYSDIPHGATIIPTNVNVITDVPDTFIVDNKINDTVNTETMTPDMSINQTTIIGDNVSPDLVNNEKDLKFNTVEKKSPVNIVDLEKNDQSILDLTGFQSQEDLLRLSQNSRSTAPREPFWKIMKQLIFWLYAMGAIWQQGLAYMLNISLIVRSISPIADASNAVFIAKESTIHVTILSIGQSLGRFTFGYISQYNKPGLLFNKAFLLWGIECALLIPCLILAISPFPSFATLYACSGIVGLGWGAAGGIFPGLISEFFGMQNYGSAAGLILAGVPIGVLVSNQIFGLFYDAEAAKQKGQFSSQQISDGLECHGVSCYRFAFIVFSVIQFITVLFAFFMYLTRKKMVEKMNQIGSDAEKHENQDVSPAETSEPEPVQRLPSLDKLRID